MRRLPARACVLVPILLLGACATTAALVPPVSPGMIAAARGEHAGVLEEGRRIYLTSCTRCHAPVPIARHSLAEWRTLMPEMIEEAHLSAGDAHAVTAYVLAARAVASPKPVAP